ncbi:GGDEF domain-containing protein [Salinisphaera sp. SPP-AMP-43]|uniref:GGDEF domain-containing protein n=1 Tax=Salinisphaera sp. SPP-AMP-43 TaxID=3121288 RepID=UPI003C6E89FE
MAIDENGGATETTDQRIARHQRTRLRRLGLSCLSYLLQCLLVAVIAWFGETSAIFALGFALTCAVIVALFYLAFRSGLNLRLREPNLTLAQVLAPALPGLALLYGLESAESQAALLLTTVVPLLYGTLDLSMVSFVVAVVVYSLGYLGVVFSHALFTTSDGILFHSWILLAAIMVVMPQVVLLSSLVNRLRRTLRERNNEIRSAMNRISAMAVRDDLTGLYNRRWLMEILAREQAMISRRAYSFCVALIDIDHFKSINDSHGHAVGDRVLCELGQYLAGAVREIDGFGRFGGEEFLWIVPNARFDSMLGAAERLRRRVAELDFYNDDGQRFTITLSIGIAQNDERLKLCHDTLLRRADHALYAAKKQGRNQVMPASIEPAKRARNPEAVPVD